MKKMTGFGFCGCGVFVERAVLPMLGRVEGAKAVAAFDVDADRARKVCGEFGIGCACGTLDELLRAYGVDVVYIASPNVFHKDQAIAAAGAGKHVFCQKPLGINASECREMIGACRKSRAKLGVGFCYRFGGAQQKAREMIQDGAIGEVSYIRFSFNLLGYTPESVGWRCDPKLSGGGPLMDLAPHLIDLAAFFLDDRAESAMAYVRPLPTADRTELDVVAILEFSRGARISIDTSFNTRGNDYGYTIAGSRGHIRAQMTMPWLTGGKPAGRLLLQAEGKEHEVPFPGHEHVEKELAAFTSAIEKNEEPPVPGEAGLHAQAAIDAIYESGWTGRRCMVGAMV